MKQTDLEAEMLDLGKSRYWSGVNKARELGIESTTGPGQRLLAESVVMMGDALKAWLKHAEDKPGKLHRAHPYLILLPPKVVAAITAQCVLDCISQHKKITASAVHIARLLEDEVKFRQIRDEEPALWQHINRTVDKHRSYETKAKFIKNTARFHDFRFQSWPKKEAVAVGMVCIELLRQSTGIIEVTTRSDTAGRAFTLIRPTDDLLDWLKNSHEKSEILRPIFLPMVEDPVDWGPEGREGGYLHTSFRSRGLVKTNDRAYVEQLNLLHMPKVYNALNTLQRTKYKIDLWQVEVMKHFWENGVAAGGLPSIEDAPLPNKPVDIETDKEERRKWRKAAARVHFENERQQSKRLQVSKVLYLADRFGKETIAFPHQLDFRGRTYPLPYYLQPQGPDFAKSLLRFANGVPITDDNGVSWLATNVANMWGQTSLSFNDRVKWVEENRGMITAVASDPFRNMEWTNADEPWHFLAAAREWSAFLSTGLGFVSNLPVAQDATTQGLQIYAKLLLDPVAGLATNVLPRDKPGDVYQDVADKVVEKLKQSSNPYAPLWLAFGINRKTTKRQAMTLTYGSVFYSCKQYTVQWFYECLAQGMTNPFNGETYQPCQFLSEIIWESIGEVVASARIGMDWFREIATICMDNDVTISWFTPNGFLVKMDYPQMNKYDVKTTIGPVVRQHRIRLPGENKNRRKNINAIAANVIHSYDGVGGLLGEIIDVSTQQGITDHLAVHDSLSVHAQHAGLFAGCIRQAAVNTFTPNLLEDFRYQIACLLPDHVQLPPTPARGTMDLTQVLDSQYYWN